MPRGRAADYDAKRHAILDGAATLFAKDGYLNANMHDIARACGSSKSMLYHYFPTKDALLFAMLHEHLVDLIAGLEAVAAQPGARAERFAGLVKVFTRKSVQSRRRHVIVLNGAASTSL